MAAGQLAGSCHAAIGSSGFKRFFFIATVSPQRCELQEAFVKDMRVKKRHC